MSSCPEEGTLLLLGTEALGEGPFAAIEGHVEGCPKCKTVLERLARRRRNPLVVSPGDEGWPSIPGFEIQAELGRGGMGVVYLAIETGLGRPVALKILPGASGPDEGAGPRRRWLREARAISSVRHPNVVSLYGYGKAEGSFYLALEYVPGGTLKRRLTGPLPPRAAAGLMETIARAVAHVHGRGLHHLDLKPSNILLDGEEDGPWDRLTPRISDFGLALSNDDAGVSEKSLAGIRGTPAYMAPEQAAESDADVGAATDVHALGAILYELLTGHPPFKGATTLETLNQVRGQDPVPPRRQNAKIPRDLETIALKCLEKQPSRRYASAEALADDLRRCLDGKPISARPVSPVEHAWRWCRRRPGFAALLGLFALTVTSSVVGLFLLWRQSEDALTRAVASDRAASVAVHDLVNLLAETAYAPQLAAPERLEKASRAVRDLMRKMRRDRAASASSVASICDLTRALSWNFRRRGNYLECRSLLQETLKFLEHMKNRGDDPRVDERYGNTLIELGYVAHNEGRTDEALGYSLRAEEVLSGLVDEPSDLKTVVSIDGLRRTIAEWLDRGGRAEVGRRLLESHIRMLDRFDQLPGADPSIGLLAELARLRLHPFAGACEKLHSRLRRFPAGTHLAPPVQQRLAEWILSDIDPYPTGPGVSGKSMALLEPEAHADAVIQAIESRCESIGSDAEIFPAVVLEVAMTASSRAADQRGAGRFDEARRTSACLSAFARKLGRRNPDEATFHIVMSEALMQEAKLCWRAERIDYDAIEMALRKSLEEAGAALRLDPRDIDNRIRIANLQEKLVDVAAGRPSSP